MEKRFYVSKKFLTIWGFGILLLALVALGAPESVLERIATAISIGLPVYLGGQSLVDARAKSKGGDQ